MENVIILDDMSYVRYRVRELLAEKNVKVYEASTSFEFFNKLTEKKNDIDLIILEVGLIREDGFEIVEKIREKSIGIPVMILTKMNTREAFAKVIREGEISDYVLKPFDNKILLDRVMKLVRENKINEKQQNQQKQQEQQLSKEIKKVDNVNKNDEVRIKSDLPEDFTQYFMEQLLIAKENNMNLSAMIFTLIKSTEKEEKIDMKETYLILTDIVFKGIKGIFKTPNFITKHGFLTFLAVLPGYDESEVENLKTKINEQYDVLSILNTQLSEYHLENASITYPVDGQDSEELMNKLIENMKVKIEME